VFILRVDYFGFQLITLTKRHYSVKYVVCTMDVILLTSEMDALGYIGDVMNCSGYSGCTARGRNR